MQVSEILNQPLSTGEPPIQFVSRFQVSTPILLGPQERCSVVAE